jgi:hypothetical protein
VDGEVVGMSELQEQAITSMASTNAKTVNNTFLLGFMPYSFGKKYIRDKDIVQ